MADSTQYREYSSGREAVFRILDEKPHLSLDALQEELRKKTIFGELTRQTVKNYRTQWKQAYLQSGAVPRLHFSGLAGLDSGFAPELWEARLCSRWKISRNKNRHRFWDESGIRLCWHRNGKVLFRFKGTKPEGYLLSVFAHAFFPVLLSTGMPEREVLDFLHGLFKERYRVIEEHYVHDTGQPLPGTKIKDFEASLGMEVDLGDGSHPTCAEFKLREPFWASDLREGAEKIAKAADLFAENIKTHLEVPKAMTKVLERMAVQHFNDAGVVSVSGMIECDLGWCVRCLQRRMLPFSANSGGSQWDRICEDCARALVEKMQKKGDRHE